MVFDSTAPLPKELWNSSSRTITFLEGPAGIGKSTFCRRLAYLWAKENHSIHGRTFHLVLLLEARNMISDFKSCIVHQLFPKDFSLDADVIYKCISECGENCLFLLDGVDELSKEHEAMLQRLLKGGEFRRANWLITGRPEVTSKFIEFVDQHLKITGFTEANIKSFIAKYFDRNNQSEPREKLLTSLQKYSHLRELAVNPFTTLLLCVLVEDNQGEIPTKQTDILEQVILSTCRRYTRKVENSSSPVSENSLLWAAGRVAHSGFKAEKGTQMYFRETDVKSLCDKELGEHLLRSGLLNRDFAVSRLQTADYCYFSHKSIHDFMCARCLASLNREDMEHSLAAIPFSYFRYRDIFKYLFSLSDKETELLAALRYLLRCLFSKDSRAFGLKIHMAIQDLSEVNTTADLLQMSAELICKDDRLHKQMCMHMVQAIHREQKKQPSPYSQLEHLVLQQKTLPPVVVAVMTSGQQMEFENKNSNTRALYLRPNYISRDLHDFMLTATIASPYISEKLFHYTIRRFMRFPPLTLSWVHCDNVKAAIALLQDDVNINVLSVWLLPGLVTVKHLTNLVNCLNAGKKSTTVFLFCIHHPHDDQLYIKMLDVTNPYTHHSTSVRRCTSTFHYRTVQNYEHPRVFGYEFLTSPQQMYHDKFCPY